MNRFLFVLCLVACSALGCSPAPTASTGGGGNKAANVPAGENWEAKMGQQVTIEGTASELGGYASVLTPTLAFGIDGLAKWPEGFYDAETNKGKKVKVTGTVGKTENKKVQVSQGPAPAKERFVLKEAKWEEVK